MDVSRSNGDTLRPNGYGNVDRGARSIRVRTRPLVSNYALKAGASALDEPVVVARECASDKDGTTVVGAP